VFAVTDNYTVQEMEVGKHDETEYVICERRIVWSTQIIWWSRSLTFGGRVRSRMAGKFMGYAVSITCRNDLGSYQGQICNVDPKEQTITLKKAFKNGIPCQVPQVTLR
jgi:hypothetical protein